MISHVNIGVKEFQSAFDFYALLMNELGARLKFSNVDESWAGWIPADVDRPLFIIGLPFNGEIADAGNGQMIALLAPTRAKVDSAYAAALKSGAVCEGAPGLRPHYHPDYYGAYFRDLDGNKICVCCHSPESE